MPSFTPRQPTETKASATSIHPILSSFSSSLSSSYEPASSSSSSSYHSSSFRTSRQQPLYPQQQTSFHKSSTSSSSSTLYSPPKQKQHIPLHQCTSFFSTEGKFSKVKWTPQSLYTSGSLSLVTGTYDEGLDGLHGSLSLWRVDSISPINGKSSSAHPSDLLLLSNSVNSKQWAISPSSFSNSNLPHHGQVMLSIITIFF